MKIALVVLVLIVVALAAWVRFAPHDPGRWHVDPLAAAAPARGGWLIRPAGGNAPAPVLAASPEEVLAALAEIAADTPRTRILTGSVAEARITWVTRSALWGFPDYTTATAVGVDGGASPVILARLRFGADDMGVNRARVEDWVTRLAAQVPAP